MNKLLNLAKENMYLFGFLFSLLSFTVVVLLAFFYYFGLGALEPPNGKKIINLNVNFYSAVIIAPLWETLVFQAIPIFSLKYFTDKAWLLIVFSSVIFSLAHISNSILNAFQAFFIGLIYAFSFIYWQERKKNYKKGFESALMIHSLHNLYQFGLGFVPAEVLFRYF